MITLAEGTLTFNANGSYTYDPDNDFDDLTGADSQDVTFTFTATFGGITSANPITVTITVINDPTEVIRENVSGVATNTILNQLQTIFEAGDDQAIIDQLVTISSSDDVAQQQTLESLVPNTPSTVSTGVEYAVTDINNSIKEQSLASGSLGLVSVSGVEDKKAKTSQNSTFFYSGNFSVGNRSSEGEAVGYDYNSFNIGVGYQRDFSNLSLGVGANYTTSTLDMDNGSSDINSFSLSAYAYHEKDSSFINGSLILTFVGIETERVALGQNLNGDGDAFAFDLSAYYGRFYSYDKYKLSPIVGIRFTNSSVGDIEESGVGSVTTLGQDYTSLYLSVGGVISHSYKGTWGQNEFSFLADASFNVLADDRDSLHRFNSGGDTFDIRGVDEPIVAIAFGFGWSLKRQDITYELGYKLRFNEVITSNNFTAKISHSF